MPRGTDDKVPDGAAIYFEFTRVGAQMRVAAIDSRTGTEVVVITPASATQLHMQSLALAKLKRRLAQPN